MIVCGEPVCRWVAEGVNARYAPGDTAIGWLDASGQLAAGILYTDYTRACIALTGRVVNPAAVHRRWLFAAFDYPFNQLGVKRLISIISSSNIRSILTSERLGWQRETTLADYFPDGDGIVYVMRREDCRWLGYAQQTSKGNQHALQSH